MENIYMTKNINENLDLRILSSVVILLNNKIAKTKKEDLDYFQVFEVRGNKLYHKQEVPEQCEEYILKCEFKNMNIWAVRGEDEKVGEYWTVMFPEDY